MDARPSALRPEDVLAHAGWLRGLAARLVADGAAAEDLVQETWLAALEHPPRNPVDLRPWLARVIGNLARNRGRGERRRRDREALAHGVGGSLAPDAIAGEVEAQRLISEAVLALEEPLRTTLVLRYFRGLNSTQIEALQGVSASTVRWRLARAIELLRVDLDRRCGGNRDTWHSALTLIVSHKAAPLAIKATAGITGVWIMGTATKLVVTACVVAIAALGLWKWNAMERPAADAPKFAAAGGAPEIPAAVRDKPSVTPIPQAVTQPDARTVVDAPAPRATALALLRVQVVAKESGRPLAGVHVVAQAVEQQVGDTTTLIAGAHGAPGEIPATAQDGIAELEIPARTAYRVRSFLQEEGVAEAEVEVEPLAPGETRELTLELRSATDLPFCGRVVDAVSRQPVADVAVWIRAGAIPEEAARKRVTDSDGRFEVRVQSWNRPALTIGAPGYASAWVVPCTGHERPETALELVLSRPATLRVRLIDATGLPIEGARLSVVVPRYRLTQPADSRAVQGIASEDDGFRADADVSGMAELTNLPPGAGLELSASRGREVLRREASPLVLAPGEVRELTWRIGSGCRVFGFATEADGQPAAGQEIWLQPARMHRAWFLEKYDSTGRRRAKCAADGSYEIPDVPPGAWLVGPADGRGQNGPWQAGLPAAMGQLIEVVPELAEARVDIKITRDLAIRGRVESPDGQPIGLAQVSCVQVEGGAMLFGSSADDGSFLLGPLVEGDYRLVARPLGPPGGLQAQLADSSALVVRAGDPPVVLRLQRGCSISGRVIDAVSGETLEAQLLLATIPGQASVENKWSYPSASREKGFEIHSLQPGSYTLAAHTSAGAVGLLNPIVLISGAQLTDVEIRVERGATVRVRYDGPLPSGNFQCLVDGVPVDSDGILKGTQRSFSVPAGHATARMSFYPPPSSFDLELDLKPGETRELNFDGAWH